MKQLRLIIISLITPTVLWAAGQLGVTGYPSRPIYIKGGTGINVGADGTLTATGSAVVEGNIPFANLSSAVRGKYGHLGAASETAFRSYTSIDRVTLSQLNSGLAAKSPAFANQTTLAKIGASGGGLTYAGQPVIPNLAMVATTGQYGDLSGKPALSTVATSGAYSDLSDKPALSTVATSGSYTDLSNKPTIPAAQVNSDWNASTGVAKINNKPTLATVATTGSYTDLSNKPATYTLPTASTTVKGGVYVDGTTIQVDGGGVIHSTVSAGVNSFGGRGGDVMPAADDYAVADITGLQDALNLKANTAALGTAAAKDVPASGNASTTQVVMGSDTRLGATTSALPSTFFGIHYKKSASTDSPQTPFVNLGFGSIRLWDVGTNWIQIEPTEGSYSWSKLDELVASAQSHNTEIVMVLGQPPAWATGGLKDNTFGANYNSYPPNTTKWATYVAAVGNRYKNKIKYYEVWNEPNISGFWRGTVGELATLTQIASQTLKAIDPTIKIVSASPTTSAGVAYLDSYLAAGASSYVDIIGVHLYNSPAEPEGMIGLAQQFRSVMYKNGVGTLPLWNTESTWLSYYSSGVLVADATVTPMSDKQASSYAMRMFLSNWLAGVDRCFLYGVDHAFAIRLVDLTTPSTVTPVGLSLGRFISWATGKKLVKYDHDPSTGMYSAAAIDANGMPSWYIWTEDAKAITLTLDPTSGAGYATSWDNAKADLSAGTLAIELAPKLVEVKNNYLAPHQLKLVSAMALTSDSTPTFKGLNLSGFSAENVFDAASGYGGNLLVMKSGGTTKARFDSNGSLVSGGVYSNLNSATQMVFGGSAQGHNVSTTIATSTATSGSQVGAAINRTYNQTSGTAANTDLQINRTETAIGSGAQKLIAANVNGTEKFSVDNTGKITGGSLAAPHSSTHATAGSDPITPAAIGAATATSYIAPTSASDISAKLTVAAALGGGTVHIPAGTYTTYLTIPDNVSIEGEGRGVTVLKLPDHTTQNVVNMGNKSRLAHLTIDGNKANQTNTEGGYGVLSFTKTSVSIDDVEVKNTNGIGIGVHTSPDTIISHAYVHDTLKYTDRASADPRVGIWVYASDLTVKQNVTIDQCDAYNNGLDGVIIDASGVSVVGGFYTNNGLGMPQPGVGAAGVYVSTRGVDQTIISGVNASKNTGMGIDIPTATTGITITGNVASGNNNGGIVIAEAIHGVVSGNISFNNGQNAQVSWQDAGIAIKDSDQITVTGNSTYDSQVTHTQYYGLLFEGSIDDSLAVGNNGTGNTIDYSVSGVTGTGNNLVAAAQMRDATKIQGTAVSGVSGSGGVVATTTGSHVNGNCAKWDANGNVIDAGAACGSSSGNMVNTGASAVNQIPKYTDTTGTALAPGFTVGTGANNLLQLDASSRLLLGAVATPAYTLDMDVPSGGGARINAASGQATIHLAQAGTDNGQIVAKGGAGTDIAINGTRYVYLQTAGVNRATIMQDGTWLFGNVAIAQSLGAGGFQFSRDQTHSGLLLQTAGTGYFPYLALVSANGTLASPTATTSGKDIGELQFAPYTGAAYAGSVFMKGTAAENWTTSAQGFDVSFFTRPVGSNATPTERMKISASGDVTVAGAVAAQKFVEKPNVVTGTTYTVSLTNGTLHRFATTGNATVTLPTLNAGESYTLNVCYGANGHTLTFAGATVKWANGVVPTPTSVSNKCDKYVFDYDGYDMHGSDGGRNY